MAYFLAPHQAGTWEGSHASEVQQVGEHHGQLAGRRSAEVGGLQQAAIP